MSDIHDDLSAAFKELSNESGTGEQKSEDSQQPAASIPTEKSGEEVKTRDESGKFAPKVEAKDAPPADKDGKPAVDGKSEEKPATDGKEGDKSSPPKSAARAPVSWTPQEREHWEKAPAEIQAAVMRREREITEALRVSAAARQQWQEFERVMHPYMPLIQQEGGTPFVAIQRLMNTAAALRTAPAPQRAELVANLIINYGVDVGMLDSILSTKVQPGGQGDSTVRNIVQEVDKRLAPVTQFMQNFEQRQQQSNLEPLQQEITTFLNDPKNEFAQDVLIDMSDLLTLAAHRGQQMTLQEAYNRATLAHPEISKILESRKANESAAQQTAAARRAKDAAVSVSDNGAPSQSEEEPVGDDIRSAVLASIKHHARTR